METEKKEKIITPGLIEPIEDFERVVKNSGNTPILICGPSGSGKTLFLEIFEKLQHNRGKKTHFLSVAGLSEDLILSELFGHVRGAFTGANHEKKGHIAKAEGGVLILDEIGKLSQAVQNQLLVFIETRQYYQVGGTETKTASVKIVATTNKWDHFEKDFWYRFDPFFIPGIHERRGDILYLLKHFIPQLIPQIRPWEVFNLIGYNWPGNAREIDSFARYMRSCINTKMRVIGSLTEKHICNNTRFEGLNYFLTYQQYFWSLKKEEQERIHFALSGYNLGIDSEEKFPAFPEFDYDGTKQSLTIPGGYSYAPEKMSIHGIKAVLRVECFDRVIMGLSKTVRRFPFLLPFVIAGAEPFFEYLPGRIKGGGGGMLQEQQHQKQSNTTADLLEIMNEKELKRRWFEAHSEACGGNIAEVARQTGMSEATAYRWNKEYKT